ncbi:ExeA family protein [Thiohalobacter thiocyanaticus]|uniref:AAA family ATPase n=1 Tax=Thiohalobacter thiocyanaticus TaxID=585455 RepID=A0A426QKH8_9GAMM|nr:AAA family ATPase [Thiohalobacter thiocyanaticus]RRQ22258.1 AAA family ATPase [Thiohalobacter thiocyanaticus]
MYLKFYGLDSKPFSIAPDPRFLYLSERHREALAHLLFGLGEGGGFVQLTGEVGTGKTTLSRAVLEQVPPHVDVAMILNPRINEHELIATLCDELGVAYPANTTSIKALTDALTRHLLRSHADGRRTVLLIDEAQNLSREVLEQVRLLTNLETADEKLLQIILIGQPELKGLLAREDLRQLAQRITARYHLEPLTRDETRAYIQHRLRVCGGPIDLFTPAAMDEVQRLSGGVPRLINILCDRALLGGYVEDRRHIDRRIVRRAAGEVLPQGRDRIPARRPVRAAAALGLVMIAAGALAWLAWQPLQRQALPALAWLGPESGAQTADVAPAGGDPSAAAGSTVETVSAVASRAVADATPAAALEQHLKAGDAAAAAAWDRLFQRWGMEAQMPGQPACEQAQALGLQCLQRTGNWNQLRRLDRPAVLQLLAGDGRRVPVLLDGLEADRARLQLDGQSLELPLATLDRYWMGEYVLLWRSPIAGELLRQGDVSEDVAWLRRVLVDQGILGPVTGEARYRFDAGLQQAVEQFQARQGLQQDGVVGVLTLIQLNNADRDNRAPRLRAAGQG